MAVAFPATIAICALAIFFCLQIPNGRYSIDWWGNNVVALSCEGEGGCSDFQIPEKSYSGHDPGTFNG